MRKTSSACWMRHSLGTPEYGVNMTEKSSSSVIASSSSPYRERVGERERERERERKRDVAEGS